jgi:hypothetical protein
MNSRNRKIAPPKHHNVGYQDAFNPWPDWWPGDLVTGPTGKTFVVLEDGISIAPLKTGATN